ncbi:MAG: hypothetical protein LBS19_00070 [Clostridiales bacterium]|jgi:hypothetical protein|nr:hypothetical protein [Clostridiales bacterium]
MNKQYLDGFGGKPGDCRVIAEIGRKIVGAAWKRIIPAFGHVDDNIMVKDIYLS